MTRASFSSCEYSVTPSVTRRLYTRAREDSSLSTLPAVRPRHTVGCDGNALPARWRGDADPLPELRLTDQFAVCDSLRAVRRGLLCDFIIQLEANENPAVNGGVERRF